MGATRNSGASLRSSWLQPVLALIAAVCLIAFSDWWFFSNGYLLFYGDAQAHLNISRSIIDSRTPEYGQIGNVWLPVLHVICLPFVVSMSLWSSGLAGTIPVSACLIAAAFLFFLTARNVYGTTRAAWVVVGCLLLNPNLLYLGAIPMTECVFLVGLAALLYAADRDILWLGIVACWWMCLTRYDGWFLIPFAAAWFAWNRRRLSVFFFFCAIAGIAPLYWIAHNWYETGNPLDFFNGPYSAKAIQGDHWYPGLHNWLEAIHYYCKAGQVVAGWPLLLLGVIGFFCVSTGRRLRSVTFLLLTPAFYVWSMHSSGNPVRIPQLYPNDYYNSRYAIALAVWAAFAVGAIVPIIPCRWRKWSPALVFVTVFPWLFSSRQDWLIWKESYVNSRSRLAWTTQAADYLDRHYVAGQGIKAGFGDLTGIFCHAKIALKETLHEGNGPTWLAEQARPDLLHTQSWAISQNKSFGPHYRIVKKIVVQGAPPLLIFHRTYNDRDSLSQTPRRGE